MPDKTISEIANDIKETVDMIASAVLSSGLTLEDLKRFDQHCNELHATGPILDPTAYREALHQNAFERVAERITLLRSVGTYIDKELERQGIKRSELLETGT